MIIARSRFLLQMLLCFPSLRPSTCSFGRHRIRSSPTWSRKLERFSTVLEVEQKFSLTRVDVTILQERLRRLGFDTHSKSEEFTNVDCQSRAYEQHAPTMIDWYYDLDRKSHPMLMSHDYWLRFRQVQASYPDGGSIGSSTGQWQLKRGTRHDHHSGGATTVYEELTGTDALNAASLLLQSFERLTTDPVHSSDDSLSQQWGHDAVAPPLTLGNHQLIPFARISTRRQSWTRSPDWNNSSYEASNCLLPMLQGTPYLIQVDLDTTDFGYGVGEVEVVVANSGEVSKIRDLIRQLSEYFGQETAVAEASSTAITVGKLEYYLQRYRRDLYQVCIDAGTMK
jgi:CYTH domain